MDGRPPPPSSVDHGREPCPDRILDDIGGAFGMGAIGGGAIKYFKGLRDSPSGHRLAGGLDGIRRGAPRIGGSFAVWGGLFSSFDCMLVYFRQKEDPWNSISSGALTAGLLQLRSGPNSAMKAAAMGGVLLAMIEGLAIMLTKMSAPPPPRMQMPAMGAPMPPGMEGLPAPPYGGGFPPNAMATAQASPEVAGSSAGESAETQESGGMFSWLGWGKPKQESSPDTPVDLSEDGGFAPPPFPKEFQATEPNFR